MPIPRSSSRNLPAALIAVALMGFTQLTTAQTAPATNVAATETFAINRFKVEGASSISSEELTGLLAPFTGPKRVYGDIQRALEAVEIAYRKRGLAAVQVFVPEQTLDRGEVLLRVVESRIAKVEIKGAVYRDNANIRAALPALKEGITPNAQAISANVRVANENPARQVDVTLAAGSKEDEVNANVTVQDFSSLRILANLDNTGSDSTGKHRFGIGVQHANLFDRDHVGTLQYTTSVEKPSQVSLWSAGYRLPIYEWGGALDLYGARSNVSAGTTQTTAGPLSFTGKGNVFGLRYNHYLPRLGEYTHKLVGGIDYRAYENQCTLGTFGAAGCGPAAFPVTVKPLSLTYAGEWVAVGRQTGYSLGLTYNLGGGKNGGNNDFNLVRGGVGTVGMQARYSVWKFGLSHAQGLPADFQVRAGLSGQYANQALIPQEQFGYAGSSAVRGFLERELVRDRGYYGNLELYGPDWGSGLAQNASLRLLAFYDFGSGNDINLANTGRGRTNISSTGFGLRLNVGRTLTLRGDIGRVLTPGGAQAKGDTRGHFSLNVAF